MAGTARYIFIASLDVAPEKEALFNELYDTEHVPLLLKVPGVLSARRCKAVQGSMAIAGKIVPLVAEGEPNYSAIYELESAEVLVSEAWAKALEWALAGRDQALHPRPPSRAEELI